MCKMHRDRRYRQVKKGKLTWEWLEQRGLAVRLKKNTLITNPDPDSWICPECGSLVRGQFFVWPERRKEGAFRCACRKCHAERRERLKKKNPRAFLEKKWRHDCAYKIKMGVAPPEEYTYRGLIGGIFKRRNGVYAPWFRLYTYSRALLREDVAKTVCHIDWAREMERVGKVLAARRYYKANSEKEKIRVKKYKHANPDKRIGWSRVRLKRTRAQSDGTVTASTVGAIIEGNSKCFYCGVTLSLDERSLDHIVPIATGGHHSTSNLVVSCKPCNTRKNKTDVWRFVSTFPEPTRTKIKCKLQRKFGLSETQNEFLFKFS